MFVANPLRLMKQPIRRLTRNFASVSTHARLPATLYRIQQGQRSNLVPPHPDGAGIPIDEVKVSPDELIETGTSLSEPLFNGAIFMPNTQLMQEVTRDAYDAYWEENEACKPVIVRLSKGTPVPQPLLLLQRYSQFALQFSHARTLHELNEHLNGFYSTHATILDAGDWFNKNQFVDSIPDEDMLRWMSH